MVRVLAHGVQASLAVTLHSEHDGMDDAGERLVLVHGFGQTCRCWGPMADDLARDHELVRIDAPGHGDSSDVRADLPETAALLAKAGGPAIYVGYSMGGRMALHVALDHPDVVRGLVLVGATPGIEDDQERADRRGRDLQLAIRLREAGDAGLDDFISDWLSQPLFSGLPPWARFESERRRNTAEGLASSLELTGTGNQQPRWADLPQLGMPVLLVAGASDTSYATIATRMAHLIGPNAQLELIPNAGHAAHLEQPDTFVAALRAWLDG
jgi:2-succinyl-6-hydroxy-2,4-cyclohexadiene-1-carboxylate synthase